MTSSGMAMWKEGHRKKVLVGSCGGLAGVYLARRFACNPALSVFGADIDPDVVTRFFVSKVYKLPRCDSDSYVDELVDLLVSEEVDFYIPTHSTETREVARHDEEIRSKAPNVSFLVCPFDTFEALDDKQAMTKNLSASGIPTPELIAREAIHSASYPLFVKRRIGSGAYGAMIVQTPSEMEAVLAKDPDLLAFECMKGPELTIDCMFDRQGHLLGFNQRRRIRTSGGAVVVTKNDYTIDCEPYLRKFESSWVFRGCVNFQCIVSDGAPYFTDVNLRYPAGGLPLSVESGLDVPRMLIEVLSGADTCSLICEVDRSSRAMYRYYDEVFEVGS